MVLRVELVSTRDPGRGQRALPSPARPEAITTPDSAFTDRALDWCVRKAHAGVEIYSNKEQTDISLATEQ